MSRRSILGNLAHSFAGRGDGEEAGMHRLIVAAPATSLLVAFACDCRGVDVLPDAGPEDAGGVDAYVPRRTAADANFSGLDLYVAPAHDRLGAAWVPRQKATVSRYLLDIAPADGEYDFTFDDGGTALAVVVTPLDADAGYKLFVTGLDPSGLIAVGDPGVDAGPLPDAGGPPPRDGGGGGGADAGEPDAGPGPDAGPPAKVPLPMVSPEVRVRTAPPRFSADRRILTSATGEPIDHLAIVPWDTARITAVLRRGASAYATYSENRGATWTPLRFIDFDVVDARATVDAARGRVLVCYTVGAGSPALKLATSDDRGITWSRVTVAPQVASGRCDVAVGANGRVFVLGVPPSPDGGPEKIAVWRSDTGGGSFAASTGDIDVPGIDGHDPNPRMAVDPKRNRLYVAYEMDARVLTDGGTNSDFDVMVATSVTGGLAFRIPSVSVVHNLDNTNTECLPISQKFNQWEPTLFVDVESAKGTVWVGFTDERGVCTPGCPTGVIAESENQGLGFDCTSAWDPGRDLTAPDGGAFTAGDVRGSPQAVRDYGGQVFLLFPARSRATPDSSLYLTRFDPDAENRRGKFYPPDSSGTALSKRIFSGVLKAGAERNFTAGADPHATLWILVSGEGTPGPGVFAVTAP